MIKAVIFDLDGVLIDTERPFLTHFANEARTKGFDISFDILVQTIGISALDSSRLVRANAGAAFPYDEIREAVNNGSYKTDCETQGISKKPGLEILFSHLKKQKIPIAIATSTYRERTEWKLQYAGLSGLFDAIVCGDEIKNGKPAPDIFLQAAKNINTAPKDCVGFEDSPAGLRALAAAGIRSIFIKDLVEPPPDVLATVWKRLQSLDEAVALF